MTINFHTVTGLKVKTSSRVSDDTGDTHFWVDITITADGGEQTIALFADTLADLRAIEMGLRGETVK